MERQLAPPQVVIYEFGQLSCLGYLENRTPPPFDYCKFDKYQNMCSNKERVERKLSILRGEDVKAVEEYNFEKEFLLLYGSMDRSSAKYKALLKQYKISRVEEIKAWEKDEKSTKELTLSKRNSSSDQLELIRKSEEELGFYRIQIDEAPPQFSNLSPITEDKSKGRDWFILPRPTLVDINRRKNTFAISWKSVYGLDIDKKDVVKDINLGVFDPLVRFPDITLTPKGCPVFTILSTFRALLNSNPRGVVKEVLWKYFEKKHDYIPEINNLGFPGSRELFHTYPDVFYILVCDGRPDVEIIFPGYLRRIICSMKKLLQRIWHHIQVCLYNNGGRLKSTEIEKKMVDLYRYKILPKSLDHWGFSNIEEFIEYLLEQFKTQSDKLRFIPDPKLHRKGDKAKFLIRVHKGNEDLIRIAERYFNPLDLQSILVTSGIPNSEFIGHSETYNYERDDIQPGDKFMTLPLDIFSPIKFYVIKDEHFNQVTEMIRELTAFFSGARNNRELINKSTARFEHLRIGAVVAAFFEYECDGELVGEWHRGRIVKLDQEKKSATVFSVDLAFQMEILIKNIRYLPRNFFAMKAQAVSSCLSYGVYPEEYWKPTRSSNPDDPRYFKDVYKRCFSELLKKRICDTIFLNITTMKPEQKFSWAVSLGVVSIETDRGLYVPIERLHPSSYKGYHTVTANFMYNSRKKLKEIRKKAKAEASIQQGAGPSGDQNQQGASGDNDQQRASPSGDQDATKTSK